MSYRSFLVAALGLAAIGMVAQADPLGTASAFNLVALGSATYNGDVNTQADVTGRIAAANLVGTGTTVGSNISGLYSSPNNYALVSTAGFLSGESFNVNAPQGNVYAPGTNGNINFNGGGSRVTSGASGIDFNSLRSYLQSYSAQLGNVAANGTVGVNTDPHNPSFLELYGTNSQLDVFSVTGAQLANTNRPLDIITPQGATVLINVLDSSATLNSALYYMGTQHAGDDTTDDLILFNFPTATAVTVNGQLSASILAPYAYLSGSSQMDGNFIAAQIGQTGEVHDPAFAGSLPQYQTATPEPGSLSLVAGALVSALAVVKRRSRRAV